MIKFKTITKYDLEMFDVAVTRHLNDGWKLVGSVSVAINSASRDHEYVIAVTKEVKED
jgi:hypothetical protein